MSVKLHVQQTLQGLERHEIITRVDEPTPWVNRMVVAQKKSGELRMRIDPKTLNQALKRERHPLLILLENELPGLAQAKTFSKLDVKNGYWHCVRDHKSSLLTTFQTTFGRYRWLRLPFGLAASSEIFQKRLQAALDGLQGVVCVNDDILVHGTGQNQDVARRDHDQKLARLLNRCTEQGIHINRKKLDLNKEEVIFLGHKLTDLSLTPTRSGQSVKYPHPPMSVEY